jgi:hypothetical protein
MTKIRSAPPRLGGPWPAGYWPSSEMHWPWPPLACFAPETCAMSESASPVDCATGVSHCLGWMLGCPGPKPALA